VQLLKRGVQNTCMPIATVVEELPVVQTYYEKKKLKFGFGKPAVPH